MLSLVPVSLAQAKTFVSALHRHNAPPTGWKFGVGVAEDGVLVGVATAGRPVSRVIQNAQPLTLEINRTCTDGTRNANSMLYGALWRAARALGYTRCITYIQCEETGASLRAAGWRKVRDIPPGKAWIDGTADPRLRAMRDPIGTGGIARQCWHITTAGYCGDLFGEP